MPDVEQHEGSHPRRGLTPPRRPRPPSEFYSKLHNFTTGETSRRGRDKAGPKRTRERRHPKEEEDKKKEEEVKGKQCLSFSIRLSDEEMMQDYMAFTGAVPLRKPSKKVQKLVDRLFPGLELSKITLGKYKVEE